MLNMIDAVNSFKTSHHQLLCEMKIRTKSFVSLCLIFLLRCSAKKAPCSGMPSYFNIDHFLTAQSRTSRTFFETLSCILGLLAGICGKAKESPKSPANSAAPENHANGPEDEHRIVNGWDAPARPFLVLIRAVNPRDAEDYETCGGAILNRFKNA